MIREQINPLDMNLDELEEYLNEQDKDTGSDAEKFSTYPHKLDQSHAITEDEREALYWYLPSFPPDRENRWCGNRKCSRFWGRNEFQEYAFSSAYKPS